MLFYNRLLSISYLIGVIGAVCVFSEILRFTSFKWPNLSFAFKACLIEASIIACVTSAYFGYKEIGLFCASIFTGALLALIGQTYLGPQHTYQFFLIWGMLISGWVIFTNSSWLWFLLILILNLTIWTWWHSYIAPDINNNFCIYICIALFYAGILISREIFQKNQQWLQSVWSRLIPITMMLFYLANPIINLIYKNMISSPYLWIVSTIGLIGHIALYYFYRYKKFSIECLIIILLSILLITICIFDKIFFNKRQNISLKYFLNTITIITLFYFMMSYIINLSHKNFSWNNEDITLKIKPFLPFLLKLVMFIGSCLVAASIIGFVLSVSDKDSFKIATGILLLFFACYRSRCLKNNYKSELLCLSLFIEGQYIFILVGENYLISLELVRKNWNISIMLFITTAIVCPLCYLTINRFFLISLCINITQSIENVNTAKIILHVFTFLILISLVVLTLKKNKHCHSYVYSILIYLSIYFYFLSIKSFFRNVDFGISII